MGFGKLTAYLQNNQKMALLAFVSASAMSLLAFRMVLGHNWDFLFLAWNLFLAWTPLFFAKLVWEREMIRPTQNWLLSICFFAWLLFFPNAPYIITDLKHLRTVPADMVWYDSIMIFTFAVSGFLAGLYSIRIVYRIASIRWNQHTTWLIIASSMVMSGFGIFLGRFGRWNSWDIITNPYALTQGIFQSLQNPLAIKHTLVFSFVLMLLYFAFHFFAELKPHESSRKYS